jgi:UDP-N-acetylglucosamine 2-epimerase
MPEELNRVVADHLSSWLFAPTPTAVENLAREGIREGVLEVGDLMRDLVAEMLPAAREPAVLRTIGDRLHVELAPGRYLFATVHRAENRAPEAILTWTRLLRRAGTVERPVILALHPGTRAAMAACGIEPDLGPGVTTIEPQGYRSTLALQLHAAAVLTDSGGVQRESAWLGTPCLVLRGTTEWIEAVAESAGAMVLVGLDEAAAARELERLAPLGQAEIHAARRAASVQVVGPGAGDAIGLALAGAPRASDPAAR